MIINNIGKIPTVRFGALRDGDVFFHNGHILMKMESIPDESNISWNCVFLENGEISILDYDDKVILISYSFDVNM